MRRWIYVPAAVLMIATACGSSDSEPATTGAASSSTPAAGAGVVEIVFDGTECTLSPDSVPAGDRAFLLTNDSDVELAVSDVYVNNAHPDHTFQELVDMQAEAGGPGTYFPEPDWEPVEGVPKRESSSFAAPPDMELEENQLLGMWTLTPGTDWVLLGTDTPQRLWLCAPLEVTP